MSLRGTDNVILKDGTSILIKVTDYDTSYVVGYCVDVRGMPVSDQKRIPVRDILLRISVKSEEGTPLTSDDYSYSDLQRISAGEKI